jgi:hypothetical protein
VRCTITTRLMLRSLAAAGRDIRVAAWPQAVPAPPQCASDHTSGWRAVLRRPIGGGPSWLKRLQVEVKRTVVLGADRGTRSRAQSIPVSVSLHFTRKYEPSVGATEGLNECIGVGRPLNFHSGA